MNNYQLSSLSPITPGICIAATASGSGKTTIATGLIAALARRMQVAAFKVGPDYIDPGYHSLAAGRIGRNLDSVMCGQDLMGPLYRHGSQGADIAVVEGVMGLFDGRIPDGAGSTADIAAILGVPVLLIVDVRGIGQSVGPLVRGFTTARNDVCIAGVILNMVGTDRHAAVCQEAVEAEGIPVVGIIPRQDDVEVPSRHLGLVTAVEHGDKAHHAIHRMADLVERNCDIDKIITLARCSYDGPAWDPTEVVTTVGTPTIAMAGGPAFTFGYAEHRELLEAAGATVVTFDPLQDNLPDCDGLIIPGGFPEEHVEELAARQDLYAAITQMVHDKKPIYGECAGLLWMLKTLNGHPMLGIIDMHADMGQRLTLGYREAVALTDSIMYRVGERVVGHEFHRTKLQHLRAEDFQSAWGWRSWNGEKQFEGFVGDTVFASYLHCHPAATPLAIQRFVAAASAKST
ncbi:MAG: cobyrinate a,c-diamide synthase [Corynebacterium sp.]|nr:cobyrinate a,c-diamide synthase [Corynebacterium sp.]